MSTDKEYYFRGTSSDKIVTPGRLIDFGSTARRDTDIERDQRRRAARHTAAMAHDATDCYRLLDMLGLSAEEGLT